MVSEPTSFSNVSNSTSETLTSLFRGSSPRVMTIVRGLARFWVYTEIDERLCACVPGLGLSKRSRPCRVVSRRMTFTAPKISCMKTVKNVTASGTVCPVKVAHRAMLMGKITKEYESG